MSKKNSMTNYQRKKTNLRNLINKFDLSDDLIHLVQASCECGTILEEEEFPVKKYQKYVKKQS